MQLSDITALEIQRKSHPPPPTSTAASKGVYSRLGTNGLSFTAPMITSSTSGTSFITTEAVFWTHECSTELPEIGDRSQVVRFLGVRTARFPAVLPSPKRKRDDAVSVTPPTGTTKSTSQGAEPPPKRAKRHGSRPSTTGPDGAEGRLKCPLDNHHTCSSPMRSNGAVAAHLRRHHRRPPYCPTCWQKFASDSKRDSHIRLRECKATAPRHIEGLSARQLRGLRRFVEMEDNSQKTWAQIQQRVALN